MKCHQFEEILEQYDAGPLPAAGVAHLDVCESCRALSADFDAIRNAAAELVMEEVELPERVWVSLRNQLEAEGIIHEAFAAPQAVSRGWWTAFQRPALAGAFLSLVVVGASTLSFWSNSAQVALHPQFTFEQQSTTVSSAESVFKEELLTVGSENTPGYPKRSVAVRNSIRRNLGIVDNFIAMCEKNVHEQPGNEMAREYLYGAYAQKAELLATAMDRSGGLP